MNADTSRLLNNDELAIVAALLDLPFLDGARLRPQIADLRVVGTCGCGCPTVDFRTGPDGLELIADARVAGTDGDAILLYGHDGVLDRLEYFWVGGPPPAGWPAPEMLQRPQHSAPTLAFEA
ncbi:hypothetical protein [Paractinoplanes globisporus]|uniref:Uncharacterized protein n=1 Tax=Paractinoplanes globisporus TaxID=113565 RepID=A0ABW6WJA2_9ACTN|nr:hypothetical protein [Actinoplanes globisporus]